MIVKCEQCQTRFKIPDDKVTDKGVKVRCTKCSHTFRVTRDMAQPATVQVPALGTPAAPRPAGADPFARFGAPAEPPPAEVTRPGVFALGVEATKPPKAPPFPAAAAQPFDFGSLTPPGASAPPIPSVPAFVPPPAQPPAQAASPFDFAAIAPPAAAPEPPPAFDFANFSAPAAPPFPSQPPAAPAPPAPLPAFDFQQAAPPQPPPPPSRAQSSAPVDTGAYPGGGADGFFAATPTQQEEPPAMDGASARAMFDLPAPAQPSLLDVPPVEAEASAARPAPERVSLGRVSRPVMPAVQVSAEQEEAPRRRSVVGIVVNVAIAAVLVLGLVVVGSAFLNDGKLSADALSFEALKNTIAPSVDFVANDVSNGLYETRAGRAVFFVRGEVINRSEATVKVVVKAEIVEDGTVVRSGESWAGAPATPEELHLIDSAEALEALNRKVEKRASAVPPGSGAAFVVPFTEYPPDLKGFRVRVSARAVPVNPTAANP